MKETVGPAVVCVVLLAWVLFASPESVVLGAALLIISYLILLLIGAIIASTVKVFSHGPDNTAHHYTTQ